MRLRIVNAYEDLTEGGDLKENFLKEVLLMSKIRRIKVRDTIRIRRG